MNDVTRVEYRKLNDQELQQMKEIKELGNTFIAKLREIGVSKARRPNPGGGQSSRELSIAQTKIEEAVMWTTKDISS